MKVCAVAALLREASLRFNCSTSALDQLTVAKSISPSGEIRNVVGTFVMRQALETGDLPTGSSGAGKIMVNCRLNALVSAALSCETTIKVSVPLLSYAL